MHTLDAYTLCPQHTVTHSSSKNVGNKAELMIVILFLGEEYLRTQCNESVYLAGMCPHTKHRYK